MDMQDVERREWQSGNPTERPRSESLWGTDDNWATTREEPPDLQRPVTYRLPPSTQSNIRRDDQPIQWTSTIFQNTVGNLTREELRSGARTGHRRSDDRPDYPEKERKRSMIVDQLRELGIDTALDADEELPMEARTIIEDLMFSLQQKNNEVKHLQRKVNDLRKETKTRKRADSDEVERPPLKRPGVEQVPQAPSIVSTQSTASTTLELRAHTSQMRINDPLRNVRRQDVTPRHQPPPRPVHVQRPHQQQHQQPRQQPRVVVINGREYDEAVEVRPPGPLVPEPTITQAPATEPRRMSPIEGRIYDPEYDFDESDHSDDEDDGPQRVVHRTIEDRRIPQFWGARIGDGREEVERDNHLRNMLSRHTYVSRETNTVYVGRTATEASRIEIQSRRIFYPPRGQIYARATRGIPLDPAEVRRLRTVVGSAGYGKKGTSIRERAEAYLLLRELYQVAQRVIPEYRDRAMEEILAPGVFNPNQPPQGAEEFMLNPCITRDPQLTAEHRGMSAQLPPPSEALNIDAYGLHLLLHGRPGGVNPVAGIVIDYALRVHRRSVFGYVLTRALSPAGRESSPTFRRILASVFALPRRYREAIVEYNRQSPIPFGPQQGPIYQLNRARIDPMRYHNLTQQDVINVLLDNRIPPEWIDHAYMYGVNLINAHYTGGTMARALLEEVDHERLARIRAYGVPPPIEAWDGWRHPSAGDVTRLHLIMENEELRPPQRNREAPSYRRGFEAPAWVRVGESGLPHYLTDRSENDAQEYARDHPSDLPEYSELTLTQPVADANPPPLEDHDMDTTANADTIPSIEGAGGASRESSTATIVAGE